MNWKKNKGKIIQYISNYSVHKHDIKQVIDKKIIVQENKTNTGLKKKWKKLQWMEHYIVNSKDNENIENTKGIIATIVKE